MSNTHLDQQLVAPLAAGIKQRNQFFDNLFYDVSVLSEAEKASIDALSEQEGTLIVVPPAETAQPIRYYPSVQAFLSCESERLQALVIAGVGSSVLGTAALARNVANVYHIEVAGIVSGYGASDLITEALGGWFFYGATDSLRHQLRELVDNWDRALRFDPFAPTPFSMVKRKTTAATKATHDLDALNSILAAAPPNLRLLLGHSKGDLLLDFALEHLVRQLKGQTHRYFEQLRVVTFGAVADLPPHFKRVYQFIGALDWFGGMNSRLDVSHTQIPNAWHHLNSELPMHMPIEDVLRRYVGLQ